MDKPIWKRVRYGTGMYEAVMDGFVVIMERRGKGNQFRRYEVEGICANIPTAACLREVVAIAAAQRAAGETPRLTSEMIAAVDRARAAR